MATKTISPYFLEHNENNTAKLFIANAANSGAEIPESHVRAAGALNDLSLLVSNAQAGMWIYLEKLENGAYKAIWG
jgi:hypothetical protein